jgi:hypothetical protein
VTAALQVTGVPPRTQGLSVLNSAFHGINVTRPTAPFRLLNATISNNAGKLSNFILQQRMQFLLDLISELTRKKENFM